MKSKQTEETVERIFKVSKSQVDAFYEKADDKTKKVLNELFDNVYGDVRERIKTFSDAYKAVETSEINDNIAVSAFMKLRTIVRALNEGWKPKFTTNKYRYYPYFRLYTQSEIDDMSDDERENVVPLVLDSALYGAYAGCSYLNSSCSASYAYARSGVSLALKSAELAEYCGKQFINLWIEFLFGVSVSDEKD